MYSIWFRLEGCALDDCRYTVGGFTLPTTGQYERLQIPLTELRTAAGVPLDYEAIDVPNGARITELSFSFQWHKTGTYRFDDIVLRH